MIDRYARLVEAEIRKLKFGKSPASLYEPIHYIMALGGKRLRPLFALLSYGLYKDDVERMIRQACTVEAFHNFTLLHDDIMDKAPLRRGKPAVHEKWGVNTAILAGDVMLVKVYEAFLKNDPSLAGEILSRFNTCAAEVCEGQQWDMEFENMQVVSEKNYINMIRQKTAVLLGFSLELGALLARAGAQDQRALRELGINIGIGFQLKDDLLDVYGDHKKFGKQVGGDIIANKKTFLLINALARARGAELKALKKWLAASENPPAKVKAITQIYDRLDVKALTEKRMNQYFNKGIKQLGKLSVPDQRKDLLKDYIVGLMHRQA